MSIINLLYFFESREEGNKNILKYLNLDKYRILLSVTKLTS